MMKKIFFGFVFFLFVIQGVLAVDTEIQVKTIPFADVQVSIVDDSSSIVDTMTKASDGYGDAKFVFSIEDSSYSAIVFVKQNYQNIVDPKKFKDQDSGDLLYVKMFPKGFTPIDTPNSTKANSVVTTQENTSLTENLTQENGTILTEEKEDTNSSFLTGFAVFEKGTFSIIAYILGGVIFLGFVVFMTVKFSRRKGESSPKEVRVTKLSEIKQDKEKDLKERMDQAERKLKEAKDELEEIRKQKGQGDLKHQAEIEEAKKKLVEDEKRLIELRSKRY